MLSLSENERLWSKIDRKSDSECWLWQGATNARGHGYMRVNTKHCYAHRIVWEITRGRELQKNAWIDRTCKNNRCCNPKHLQIKMCRGGSHFRSKLVENDVIEIWKLWMTGQSQYKIADQFNVSRSSIRKIVNRNTWKHVNLDNVSI